MIRKLNIKRISLIIQVFNNSFIYQQLMLLFVSFLLLMSNLIQAQPFINNNFTTSFENQVLINNNNDDHTNGRTNTNQRFYNNSSDQIYLNHHPLVEDRNSLDLLNKTRQTAIIGAIHQPTGDQKPYLVKFYLTDPKGGFALGTMMPLNQTNLYEPRIELRYQSAYPYIELPENTKINSVVAALIVNDEDSGASGETSLSISSGNELGNFKIVSTQHSNTVQVANQLNRNTKSDYNLTIVARDHGTPPKSSSVNLVIKLTPAPLIPGSSSQSPSSTINNDKAAWESQSKPPVTDLMYFGAMLVAIFFSVILLIILVCALVQKPKGKKGPIPNRTTTNTNNHNLSRMHPSDHYCLGLTNL